MEGRRNFKDIVAEPLTEDSSEDWFEWVKNYLISRDLWKVTSSSRARPERYRVKDFAKWRRKNAAALHVIRISCGPQNHALIRRVSEAKRAWDILYDTYNNNAPASAPASATASPPELTEAEGLEMSNMRKAIAENNWSTAKEFIDRHPKVLNVDFATLMGETPLHVAAKFGHLGIVEELVALVAQEYLVIRDASGFTPLAIAASHGGAIPVARCLVNKNSIALTIPAQENWTIPVSLAFISGHKLMGRYLYSVTKPLQVFRPENGQVGPTFLHICLRIGQYDVALHLLQRCTELLFAADSYGVPTIERIAFYVPEYSLNKSQLPLWKRWAYHYIKTPSTTMTGHFCIDIQQEGESNQAGQGIMKEIYEMKLQYAQAAEILNLVCENMIFLNEAKRRMIGGAMIEAAKAENVEFLLRVTKANPELISQVTLGHSRYLPFFFMAVECRKAKIFNLLRGYCFKNLAAAMIASDTSNHLLHVAALLAPSSYLNRISGAALQMQREVQWFKAVESVVDPGQRLLVNNKELRPLEFFKENHKGLRAEGEKWMKETASSCSVVGALIVTIVFAAAITVPGGNNQDSGYPMFMKEKLFKVFLISDALSLFSSTTSVLTFLGILTSRYAEEDFLYSLPKKLIIGLSTLFLSIATMMIAFSATIMIMLQYNSSRLWVILPVPILASVPVTLFVLLQFPLLVEVFSSTYGPGLFKKKVEKWP